MNDQATRGGVMDLPDDRRLQWCEFGDPGGWPVVYCHGVPGSRLEAALFSAAAAERGLRAVALDRPGYGGTSPRPGRALGDEVDDIIALIDRLDFGSLDAIGFSGGGPHALALAAHAPERIRRVGLISSLAPFEHVCKDAMTPGYRQLWELAEADFPAFQQALAGAVAEAGDAYGLVLGGAPASDRAILREEGIATAYRRNTDEATRQGLAGMFEDALAFAARWPFPIDAVRCPVSLWHGDLDGNAPPAMGRWLARNLPDATLTEWPDAAHFEVFRRPVEVLDPHAPD